MAEDLITDLQKAVARMKEKGIEPTSIRVSSHFLTPERLPAFQLECTRLGLHLEYDVGMQQYPIYLHPKFEELKALYGWDEATGTFEAEDMRGVKTFDAAKKL